LDLSLTATGVATPDCVHVLKPPKGCTGVDRLRWFRTAIGQATAAADLVVIEQYAFSRANAHSHEIGELGGVIRLDLSDLQRPFIAVLPNVLKKFATGKGNAGKDDMVGAAARAGCPVNDNNAVDAWWLRQMALYVYARSVPVTKYRTDAATSVDWPDLQLRGAA
jgi:crossover junction endodeoxyribonuclease RuvC